MPLRLFSPSVLERGVMDAQREPKLQWPPNARDLNGMMLWGLGDWDGDHTTDVLVGTHPLDFPFYAIEFGPLGKDSQP
jgi:hypothetical protein